MTDSPVACMTILNRIGGYKVISNYEAEVRIETPYGSTVKYQIDEEDRLCVEDILQVKNGIQKRYPFSYGYLTNTITEDGCDYLDVIVMSDTIYYPGCYLRCCIIGAIKVYDELKMVCVPKSMIDERFRNIQDVSMYVEEIKLFYNDMLSEIEELNQEEAWKIYISSHNQGGEL